VQSLQGLQQLRLAEFPSALGAQCSPYAVTVVIIVVIKLGLALIMFRCCSLFENGHSHCQGLQNSVSRSAVRLMEALQKMWLESSI